MGGILGRMSDLRPCTECSRHIRVADPACPFCGAGNDAPFTPPRMPAGRLSRAAIFAGALATGAAACGTNPEPIDPADNETTGDDQVLQQHDTTTDTTDNVTPAPPPDAMMAAPPPVVDAMVAAKPPPPPPADAGVAVHPKWDPNHIPKPYGAPPARKRLV